MTEKWEKSVSVSKQTDFPHKKTDISRLAFPKQKNNQNFIYLYTLPMLPGGRKIACIQVGIWAKINIFLCHILSGLLRLHSF